MIEYSKDKLLTRTLKEVAAIREHATEEERLRLSSETLKPSSSSNCIYGQMTGYCFSPRASTLIYQCAQPFSTMVTEYETPEHRRFSSKTQRVNTQRDFTALEFYIVQAPEHKVFEILSYLRGERDLPALRELDFETDN
jgi:hypothetical protein